MNDQSAPETLPSTEQPEIQPLLEFAKTLADVIPAALHTRLRFADKGIFIDEACFETVISAYSKWHGKFTGSDRELSRDKSLRRLFGTEEPELHYLIDGKVCIVGYLAPLTKASSVRSKIPSCIGSLQNTKDYLHPRDPVLSEIPGLNAQLRPEGLKMEVIEGDRRITISNDAFDRFAKIFNRTYWLQRLSGTKEVSRRAALRLFVRLSSRVRPRGKKRGLIVPARYREGTRAHYVGVGSLVFVVEPVLNTQPPSTQEGQKQWTTPEDLQISFVYDLRRPNFALFAHEELVASCRGTEPFRLGNLNILPRTGEPPTITLNSKHERFRVDARALEPIVLAAQNDPQTQPRFFTMTDALRSFAKLFEHSDWVAPNSTPKQFASISSRFDRVRSAHGWFFFLDKHNEIKTCAPLPEAMQYPLIRLRAETHQRRHNQQGQGRHRNARRGGRRQRNSGPKGRGQHR